MEPTVSSTRHEISFSTSPGLVATWIDGQCTCGAWGLTTLADRVTALARAEQHLDDVDADLADFEALNAG